jgi:Family of unknown function (DUF6011)
VEVSFGTRHGGANPAQIRKCLFKCAAFVCENADASLFQGHRPPDSWLFEFGLIDRPDEMWGFKLSAIGWHRDQPRDTIYVVRDRFIVQLTIALATLRSSIMLRPACLCCGKMLTDPVSMARWIGPECAGTASAVLPFIIELGA